MNGDGDVRSDPNRHSASFRKRLRFSRITRFATSSWSANSGSYGVSSIPFGVSWTYSESPFSTRSFAKISRGRTTPVELPTVVTFSLFVIIQIITKVIIEGQ